MSDIPGRVKRASLLVDTYIQLHKDEGFGDYENPNDYQRSTVAMDAITDLLHYVESLDADVGGLVFSAVGNYDQEREEAD